MGYKKEQVKRCMLIILYAKDRSRLLAMVEKFLKVNSPKWLKIQFNYTHHGWENL